MIYNGMHEKVYLDLSEIIGIRKHGENSIYVDIIFKNIDYAKEFAFNDKDEIEKLFNDIQTYKKIIQQNK